MRYSIPVIEWHKENLNKFRSASNGNRNDLLNTLAMQSFQLALGSDGQLSESEVENDFENIAIGLGLKSSEVKATLQSALRGAKNKPRDLSVYGNHDSNEHIVKTEDIDRSELVVEQTYSALAEYAISHGIPESELVKAGWQVSEYEGRPCFKVPHEDGVIRCRFTDGQSPKWKPVGSGVKPCWYGFNRAIAMAKEHKRKMLVITNGQPSVIAAQYHDIPALAQTDGEGKKIELPLLARLLKEIKEHGLNIYVCYDGDKTGRDATKQKLEQLRMNGIKAKAIYFGGDDHFDLADFCNQHKEMSGDKLHQMAIMSEIAVKEVNIDNKIDGFEGLLAADDSELSIGNSVIIPFKSFHNLGGHAISLPPGKMAMIMAPSGGGKTSLLETWAESWLRDGFDVLIYTPEWTAEELVYRSVQRNGGATYDDIQKLIDYRVDTANGIPKELRHGKLMNPELISKSLEVKKAREKWPGKMFYFPLCSDITEVLERMSNRVFLQRRTMRKVVAIFDYIQLFYIGLTIPGKSQYEIIIDAIKNWSITHGIASFVGSQVLKTVGRGNSDTLLDKYDSQWIRPDAFNLIVTLNLKEISDMTGGVEIKRLSEFGIANVCKNSLGQTGQIPLRANFRYLTWTER